MKSRVFVLPDSTNTLLLTLQLDLTRMKYYLTFEELRDVVSTHTLDYQIISNRKDEYKFYEKLALVN